MLSVSDLQYMRDTVEQLFPDTCNILSVTRTSDGQGGFVETWGTAGTAIACRIDSATSKSGFIGLSDVLSGGAIQESTKWMLSLPYDTTVNINNRIEVSGYTYNISALDLGKSWNSEVRLVLER